MSVALAVVGNSTTWPEIASSAASSGGGEPGFIRRTPRRTLEQVSAKQVGGVGSLHVRARMHDHIPVAAGRWVFRLHRALGIGRARPVRDDLVERKQDAALLLAAAVVDVRHVRRGRSQAGYLQL